MDHWKFCPVLAQRNIFHKLHIWRTFSNILAVWIIPSPPPLGSNFLVCSKATLILGHL